MARTQVYGGKEQDEVRMATALADERAADDAIAEGDHGKIMADAFGLGTDYGRQVAADEREEMVETAQRWVDTQANMSDKERADFMAAARRNADKVLRQHTRGNPEGRRGRWRNVKN